MTNPEQPHSSLEHRLRVNQLRERVLLHHVTDSEQPTPAAEQQLQDNQIRGRILLRRVNKAKRHQCAQTILTNSNMALVLRDPSGIVNLTESVREAVGHLKVREKAWRISHGQTKTPPSLMFQSSLSLVLCANKKLWEENWDDWCNKRYKVPRYPITPTGRHIATRLVECYYVQKKLPIKLVSQISGASPETFCVAMNLNAAPYESYWDLYWKVEPFYIEADLHEVYSELSCDEEEAEIAERRRQRRRRKGLRAAEDLRERQKALPYCKNDDDSD